MDWIDKSSRVDGAFALGECKIDRLLFADDLVLLSNSQSGLQCLLESFAAVCNDSGMKISTSKTEMLLLSRKPSQCSISIGREPLRRVEKFTPGCHFLEQR